MNRETVKARVMASIEPQLDRLGRMQAEYEPRIIGKHHPEYDTLSGRLHYISRRLQRLMSDIGVQLTRLPYRDHTGPGVVFLLEVNCKNPGCDYWDRGRDHDLVMRDFNKHREECNAQGGRLSLQAPQAL